MCNTAAMEPPVYEDFDEKIRKLVREEIASLAGKAMRRLQDDRPTRSFTRNEATDAAQAVMGHFWGEVLAEYGAELPEASSAEAAETLGALWPGEADPKPGA